MHSYLGERCHRNATDAEMIVISEYDLIVSVNTKSVACKKLVLLHEQW